MNISWRTKTKVNIYRQSSIPSHRRSELIHRPLSHCQRPVGHVRFDDRQSANSSLPSEQSR